MRKTKTIIVINSVLFLIMLAFNNCGQPGEIRFDNPASSTVAPTEDNQISGNTPPGGGTPPDQDPGGTNGAMYVKVQKFITLNETLKADVLFVVDNSISMALEQSNMSARFPEFIKNLSAISWKVGIITTDVDTPESSTSDGRLQSFPNGKSYLDSAVKVDDAQKEFSATIQRSESGSGYEQGIFATYRFLERDLASVNPFMRSDASINIVYVTDSDETPYEGADGLPVFQKRNKPDELVKFLMAKWPVKKFQFHSIVVRENDQDCLGKNDNEAYGIQYEKLSTLTNGVKGSVCAEDYGSQLSLLSEKIKDLIKEVDLDCVPALDPKTRKAKVQLKRDEDADPLEIEKVEGKKVFLKGSLPSGRIKLEYFCPKEMLSN